MTNDEINIAIAESCGWTFVDFRGTILCREPEWEAGRAKTLKAIPDYCNDLNAMHEAEKVLISLNLYQDYWPTLEHITGSSRLAHATARQKAEAFMKTLNLWVE